MKLLKFLTHSKPHLARYSLQTPLPGFDEAYYLRSYPDVSAYNDGPLAHYMKIGWVEGRNPSAGFSSYGYLANNEDVRLSGSNPLIHFLEHGLAEGRVGGHKDPKSPAPRPTTEEIRQKYLLMEIKQKS